METDTRALRGGGIKEAMIFAYARAKCVLDYLDTARIRRRRGGQDICRPRTRLAVDEKGR